MFKGEDRGEKGRRSRRSLKVRTGVRGGGEVEGL